MPVSSTISLSTRLISTAQRATHLKSSLALSPSLRRFASTATARAPTQAVEVEEDDLPEDGPVPFSTIKKSVSAQTYNALTKGPFHYTDMSAVQAEVLSLLPQLAEPYDADVSPKPQRDLLVKAKTGTGKTIGFLVPAIEARVRTLKNAAQNASHASGLKEHGRVRYTAAEAYARQHVGTLIISPTRELAIQIAAEANKLTAHHQYGVHLMVGGENKTRQLNQFHRGRKDILVATPGRLMDVLMSDRTVVESLQQMNTLVLDEADTLLDMGFRKDIEEIVEMLPETPQRQTFLFSATVSPAIQQIAKQSLDSNHAFINCVKEDDSPVHAHIPQHYTTLPSSGDAFPHLMRLIAEDQLQNPGASKVILFCNTTKQTALMAQLMREVQRSLPQQRTTVYELHSKASQEQRRRRSDDFRNQKSGASVLVTSDVSARGVDYPNVTRVIQLGVPASGDQYIHRVGRTGRGQNMTGRGDLVLLPFEGQFPRRNLAEVPIKSISVERTEKSILELADRFDADPKAFFQGVQLTSGKQRSGSRFGTTTSEGPSVFAPDVRTRLEGIPAAISEALQRVPAEQLEETFIAMLGFYATAAENLGMQRLEVVQPLKEFCQDALEMEAPHVSPSFLSKLGMKERRASLSTRDRKSGNGWSGAPRFGRDAPKTYGGRSSYGHGGPSFVHGSPRHEYVSSRSGGPRSGGPRSGGYGGSSYGGGYGGGQQRRDSPRGRSQYDD